MSIWWSGLSSHWFAFIRWLYSTPTQKNKWLLYIFRRKNWDLFTTVLFDLYRFSRSFLYFGLLFISKHKIQTKVWMRLLISIRWPSHIHFFKYPSRRELNGPLGNGQSAGYFTIHSTHLLWPNRFSWLFLLFRRSLFLSWFFRSLPRYMDRPTVDSMKL